MKFTTLTRMTTIALFAVLAILVPLEAQQQRPEAYAVSDLGTLGGTFSIGFGVNNEGWVDGSSNLPRVNNQHGFFWRNGVMTGIGTFGGPNSSATFPLNESGVVPGAAETAVPDPLGEEFCDFLGFRTHLICRPFLWQNGVMTPLPTLGGNNGVADQVNNQAQVVGVAENTTLDPTCPAPQLSLEMKPVIWEKGQIQKLPTLPGDLDGAALSINDRGQAVGFSGTGVCANEFLHAVLWHKGMVTDLGNLGGTTGNNPQLINNKGQVVGISNLPGDSTSHGFLWENGVMSDLGVLSGDFSSAAFGINDEGQVVGQSCDINFNCRAFLWQNGVMTDLNTLIPSGSPLFLLAAFGINSGGQIVGLALQINTGELHAFLATPTEDLSNTEAGPSTAPFNASAAPEVSIPETVHKLLQQRLRYGRFGARLSGTR